MGLTCIDLSIAGPRCGSDPPAPPLFARCRRRGGVLPPSLPQPQASHHFLLRTPRRSVRQQGDPNDVFWKYRPRALTCGLPPGRTRNSAMSQKRAGRSIVPELISLLSVGQLRVAGLLKNPVNAYFEHIFETGASPLPSVPDPEACALFLSKKCADD